LLLQSSTPLQASSVVAMAVIGNVAAAFVPLQEFDGSGESNPD
jgi:hypothetical protein